MSFFADKQTLDDLNIPGRYKNNSVFHLFDAAVTAGGKKLMDSMFQHPFTDAGEINKRSAVFQYFTEQPVVLPFTGEDFSIVENYLNSGSAYSILSAGANAISKKAMQWIAQGDEYELLKSDVIKTIALLNQFYDFAHQLKKEDGPYGDQLKLIKKIFSSPKLNWLRQEGSPRDLSLFKLIKYDHLLRTGLHQEMKSLTDLIFQLDVYIAVAGVAVKRGFSYACALPKKRNVLTINGLYHPTVENAIGNTLALHQENNVIFLTGANMAGKSTLMKSFGIAVYLAHMGFPIAAENMEFSVKDALYSSINVPDNLGLGYSHFYAEVLRVKKVAEEVAADKDLVVIFDELFKGTNVKDAYDATLSITEAFSENRNSFFIISTHIIEVGEALAKHVSNFRFTYLPTVMEGFVPRYTYRLTEGITKDRHGMMIIENEGILEIIRHGSTQGVEHINNT